MQASGVIEEAEQQRANTLSVLVDAVPGDDTVSRTEVFHLDQGPKLKGNERKGERGRTREFRERMREVQKVDEGVQRSA